MFSEMLAYFSVRIRKSLEKISADKQKSVHEIRLRTGKPLVVSVFGRVKFVTEDGLLSDYSQSALRV